MHLQARTHPQPAPSAPPPSPAPLAPPAPLATPAPPAQAGQHALALRGVRKAYAGRAVLDLVDLVVGATETVAILGPNGAGKSTLLRVAATLARPDAGTVHVAGRPTQGALESARADLAYVPQEPALIPGFSPLEHIRWWRRLHGDASPAARGKPDPGNPGGLPATDLLAQVGLATAATKPAATLSRGQRQRLALALATCVPKPVWLLDEPFTALDAQGQEVLDAWLEARRGTAATVLVLHDRQRAASLADRVLALRAGRLDADREPPGGTA